MGRLIALAGAVACAAALAILGAGCGERSEPTGETVPQAYPVTVQGAGDTQLAIERQPTKLLPVSATAAAIIDALGGRARVPGAPATGRLHAFPVRAIAKTHADLVIGSQGNDTVALERAADAAGVPVLIVADSAVRDLERSILEVGLAIGAPVKARRLVNTIESKRANVRSRLKGVAATTVFVDTGFEIPIADSSFAGELIRDAGGKNVAGDADPTPFPTKRLLAADPTFYLATDASGATLADLRTTQRLQGLTAIREGRFAMIPARLLQPGADVGEAIERLARILHPDAFR
jgi:iron complex transport system substrate-binding protein